MISASHLDLGQFIFLCYGLVSDKPICVSDRSLDCALRLLCSSASLPRWVLERLRFADGRKGWECVVLPSILNVSHLALLVENCDRSFRYIRVSISRSVAVFLLRKLGLTEPMTRFYGSFIAAAIEHVKEESGEFGRRQ